MSVLRVLTEGRSIREEEQEIGRTLRMRRRTQGPDWVQAEPGDERRRWQ